MKELTQEQTISEFRKMWKWIAEETKKRKEKVLKSEYFEYKRISEVNIPADECYLCEYVKQIKGRCLTDCPIDWGGIKSWCTSSISPYMQWGFSEDWKDCYKYAKQISELSEKKEE